MNCTRLSMGDLSRQGIAPPMHDSGKKCYPGRRTVLLRRSPDHTVQGSRLAARRILFPIAAIAVAAVVIEVSAAAVTFLLVRRGWMAEVRPASAERAAAFVAHRDPLLGWGSSFAPSPHPPSVSTYGDAFTPGSGASEREPYPQHLARRLASP